ncbi:hypothetical protein CIJ63_02100 [Neisseria meningitidis]|nr:hypothetical protein [Neisseria meningitidis]MBG9080383.1 hypothetical protein [Neisseria meningitidis]MBG9086508.1 hypothetical protein [Neisseria meningitidis]MBG9090411.1 hypothetical protein [Neisseria meningitidis]RGB20861.1 hypothetical protein CIJ63_02100 [Neisseria meningitidis]
MNIMLRIIRAKRQELRIYAIVFLMHVQKFIKNINYQMKMEIIGRLFVENIKMIIKRAIRMQMMS